MSQTPEKKNIVVIGGSYVGTKAAELIAAKMHATHRTVLIEKNSHFQHLFAFPRYAVVPGFEHHAFIPYTTMFAHLPQGAVSVVRARATEVHPDRVLLDREDPVPYDYLVLATGTTLTPPGSLHTEGKADGIAYFQDHQKHVARAQNIVIVGGGANGVQLATDIKEYYPAKSVTLIHPHAGLMHHFHPKLQQIVADRCKELGITVLLEERVKVPEGGFPTDGSSFEVETLSGKRIPSDFAIMAVGQTPLSAPLKTLSPASITERGYIAVQRTLQIADPAYPHVFALGDVADTTHAKAARPAMQQAEVVAANIRKLEDGASADELSRYTDTPRGIHLSLGIKHSVKFQNPEKPGDEPWVQFGDHGSLDMNPQRIWKMKAPGLTDYHL
ncbi:FAD/NAD-P-binding domain-containing protein [Dentipellis sp. KUC8613]|nr:FAD/NAD-P-binding domain-containing protein [Dentipellis sp. KUC8613]